MNDSDDGNKEEPEKKVDMIAKEPELTENQMQNFRIVPGLKLWEQDPHAAKKEVRKRLSTKLDENN